MRNNIIILDKYTVRGGGSNLYQKIAPVCYGCKNHFACRLHYYSEIIL